MECLLFDDFPLINPPVSADEMIEAPERGLSPGTAEA
jgi:hypothetical protein